MHQSTMGHYPLHFKKIYSVRTAGDWKLTCLPARGCAVLGDDPLKAPAPPKTARRRGGREGGGWRGKEEVPYSLPKKVEKESERE